MPETAMNKNGRFVLWEDKIGTTWQPLCMEAKAKALPVQVTPHSSLWRGVATSNARHHPAAGLLVDNVDHQVTSMGNSA
jgi:hypothetical protein